MEAVAERAEEVVQRERRAAVVAFESSVVEHVELVRLQVVLPAAVRRRGRQQQVHAVPPEDERMRAAVERRADAGERKDMYDERKHGTLWLTAEPAINPNPQVYGLGQPLYIVGWIMLCTAMSVPM